MSPPQLRSHSAFPCSSNCKDDDVFECLDSSSASGVFECCICLSSPQNPVVTLCGHLFCFGCLSAWVRLHATGRQCPVCKKRVVKAVRILGQEGARVSKSHPSSPARTTGQPNAPALPRQSEDFDSDAAQSSNTNQSVAFPEQPQDAAVPESAELPLPVSSDRRLRDASRTSHSSEARGVSGMVAPPPFRHASLTAATGYGLQAPQRTHSPTASFFRRFGLVA